MSWLPPTSRLEFTPTTEVELCGHATLASGYVVLYRLRKGETAAEVTGGDESILVMIEGLARIAGAGREWGVLGERMNLFEKTPPHCLYLPNGTGWNAEAVTDCTIAVCSAPGR